MARIDDTEAAEIADARLHLDAVRQPRELADKRRAFLRALRSDSNPSHRGRSRGRATLEAIAA